jgi:elongation factor P
MAGVIDTAEFRKGMKIEVDGEPFEIIEFQHVKPGKGSAFVRTSIKSLLSGRVLQPTFKSGDKVGKPDIEELDMQYLYKQGDDYYFMDTRTYEQTYIQEKALGDSKQFLKEQVNASINASILFYNGKAIGVSLPNSVDLKVVKCDPGMRGDTVSGALKPATLETGYTVNVPLFINEGDVLKIDTRDGKYLTRVASV